MRDTDKKREQSKNAGIGRSQYLGKSLSETQAVFVMRSRSPHSG